MSNVTTPHLADTVAPCHPRILRPKVRPCKIAVSREARQLFPDDGHARMMAETTVQRGLEVLSWFAIGCGRFDEECEDEKARSHVLSIPKSWGV